LDPLKPARVNIREVSLRDGLQILRSVVPTATKLAWLQAAYGAGLRQIEAGSFVPPKLLPQMADTAEVVQFAKTLPDLQVSVLVPNLRGAERALESQADLMVLPASASAAHSQANLRKTPGEVVAELARMRAARDAAGARTLIGGGIGTAFGCTLQGRVEPAAVLRLMQGLLDAGADSVSIADTVGYADPDAVSRLFEQALRIAGPRLRSAHFHDTRGLGLANVYAAMRVGVTSFDGCLAGIGGCPHAPGASGNVNTEDMAYLFQSMGVATGLDLQGLLALRERIVGWLDGAPTCGAIWRAGLPKGLEAVA
jgi:hydroxymethylglutaryl-CoA lyase